MRRGQNLQQDLFVDSPIWWQGLTGRRRLFVEYYCTDRECFLNPAAAYIKAFGKNGKEVVPSSIHPNASRLLRDPKIKNAVNRLLESQRKEKDKILGYKMIDMLEMLSTYNPKDIVDDDGNLVKPLKDLGPLALCVTGIKTKAGRNGRIDKEIKLFDRTKSTALLYAYLSSLPPEGMDAVNPLVKLADKDVEDTEPAAEDAEYTMIEGAA